MKERNKVKRSNEFKKRKLFRTFGRILRIIIFLLNGICWTVGMLCIVGSLLIAFYSKALKATWLLDLYDFTLTTPWSVLFYYGVLLGIATMSGCFAGTSGQWWCTGAYCLLLIALALFDYFLGIRVFFKSTSLMDFIDSIYGSMKNYGHENSSFGIYPYPVEEYWDHIQRQGHCCGLFEWQDWLAFMKVLPDSCCNDRYSHRSCGKDLGHHPDNADHQTMDIVHKKGCLTRYPRRFIWAFFESSITGIVVAIILLMAFLFSLLLFLIVITCFYRPGKPITEPTSNRQRRISSGNNTHRNSNQKSDGHNHLNTKRLSNSEPGVLTYDEFGRRRLTMPSGSFQIKIKEEPHTNMTIVV